MPIAGLPTTPTLAGGSSIICTGSSGGSSTIDARRVGALLDRDLAAGAANMRPNCGSATRTSAQAGLSNVAGMVLAPLTAREIVADLQVLVRRLLRRSRGASGKHGRRQCSCDCSTPLIWRLPRPSGAPAAVLGRGTTLGVEVEQLPCAGQLHRARSGQTRKPSPSTGRSTGAEMQAVRAFAIAVRDELCSARPGPSWCSTRASQASDPAFFASCGDGYPPDGRRAHGGQCTRTASSIRNCGCSVPANLYVAGAATFPSGSFANPNLTAMALAVRLADHLIACGDVTLTDRLILGCARLDRRGQRGPRGAGAGAGRPRRRDYAGRCRAQLWHGHCRR